jgi:SAM-dependent methyltransferase
MTEIEHRVEVAGVVSPRYSEREFSVDDVAKGKHRSFVGGHWDTHGQRQLEFLTAQGLRPGHRFVDVGCGSLRAGRHLVSYLDAGNYYGIDANRSLLQSGYQMELTDDQRERLPSTHLRANDRFDVDFGVPFDMAIAQSVFTHVSLNHIRVCLFRLAKVIRPRGKFYATFFEEPPSTPLDAIKVRRKGGRPFLSEQNVFWYYREDLRWAAGFGPWHFRYIGHWGHPAGQMMVEFTRMEADASAERPVEDSSAGEPSRRPAAKGKSGGVLKRIARRAPISWHAKAGR